MCGSGGGGKIGKTEEENCCLVFLGRGRSDAFF